MSDTPKYEAKYSKVHRGWDVIDHVERKRIPFASEETARRVAEDLEAGRKRQDYITHPYHPEDFE